MKTIAMTIALAMLLLAATSDAAPEPQQSRCMAFPPFCPYGQHPICVCQDQYSYQCVWMCGSTR